MTSVELGSWRGEGVRLGQVLEALSDLRCSGTRTATRASVTNLVLVAATEDEVALGCDAVHRMGRRHPGRNIVLLPRADASPAGIDAEVVLHGSLDTDLSVWSEDVRLDVRGPAAGRLESLVEPLVLADVPVTVWFVTGLPEPDDPLLRGAATVLVDTEDMEGGAVAAMVRLTRRRVVFDLCWARLRLWRQLFAGLFDVPACRAHLDDVRSLEARGGASARLLLAGWVASRLALPPSAVSLVPAPSPGLRLVGAAGGATATFTVEAAGPGPGGGSVLARADLPGGKQRHDRVALPDDPLAWSLAEALARPGRDRAHVQALQATLGFVR